MNKNFLKYILLIFILTSQFTPTKTIFNEDVGFAAFGGIVLGALFGVGCTSFFLSKKHEKNLEKNKKNHQNEIEDRDIQITILKERLATKEKAQKEQAKNEENQKNSNFFKKLSPI